MAECRIKVADVLTSDEKFKSDLENQVIKVLSYLIFLVILELEKRLKMN